MSMTGVSCLIFGQRMVGFTDGHVISGVDHIIFCTGYQYHQPFIKKNRNTEEPLFPSGPYIEDLHEHTIYLKIPTLAFLGMVRDAVPTFLIVQAQAAFVSRFFSDQVRALCRRSEDSQHRLPYPLFMDYLLRLESICEQADKSQAWSVSSYTNPVFRWTCELDLVRTKRREIRDEFQTDPTWNTGVWSTTDMIYRCQWEHLNVQGNIWALLPFLVLSYGYKNHEHNSILPFQGWAQSLGFGSVTLLSETTDMLHSRLGPDSKDVIIRGTKRLFVLLRDRWETFCHSLPDDSSRWEEEDIFRHFTRDFEEEISDEGYPVGDRTSGGDDVSADEDYDNICSDEGVPDDEMD